MSSARFLTQCSVTEGFQRPAKAKSVSLIGSIAGYGWNMEYRFILNYNGPEYFLTGLPRSRLSWLHHWRDCDSATVLSFRCRSFNSSRSLARTLFCDWERSSEHFTDSPVGIWIARTAVSTLLTFCPPLPPDRQVSYTISASVICGSSTLSKKLTPTNQLQRLCPGRNGFPVDRHSIVPSHSLIVDKGMSSSVASVTDI